MCRRSRGWDGSATGFTCGSSCSCSGSTRARGTTRFLRWRWRQLLIICWSNQSCGCGIGGRECGGSMMCLCRPRDGGFRLPAFWFRGRCRSALGIVLVARRGELCSPGQPGRLSLHCLRRRASRAYYYFVWGGWQVEIYSAAVVFVYCAGEVERGDFYFFVPGSIGVEIRLRVQHARGNGVAG